MSERYDFVIVGAGIVGLAVARKIAALKLGTVCILEKERALGLHSSGRNSGVLHTGIYYAPDSLKAKVCAAGARLLADYCAEKKLPLAKNGKVIVASDVSQVSSLKNLFDRGRANGVRVELIDEKRLSQIEPEARTVEAAIFSPDTNVIDSKAVLAALENDITAQGVTIRKNARLGDIESGFLSCGSSKIHFGHLINAAGLHADEVAHAMGVGERYKIMPFKGIYRKLRPEAASRFRGSIYPVPDLDVPFLGVHTTKTVSGEVYVGPTAIPAFGRENYGLFSGIDGEWAGIARDLSRMMLKNLNGFRTLVRQEIFKYNPSVFLKCIQRLAPFLKKEDIQSCGKVGLRAQLVDKKSLKLVMDFLIEDGPRSTHILNAVSPAFTSSFAFADIVVNRIQSRVA